MKRYSYNVFILGDYCKGFVMASSYLEAKELAESREKKRVYHLKEEIA